MELLDFFDLNKKFDRVTVPGSQTQGHVKVSENTFFHDPFEKKKEVFKGQEYAKEYQLQEAKDLAEAMSRNYEADDCIENKSGLADIEELTSVGTIPNVDEVESEELTRVYQSYDFTQKPSSTALPIVAFRTKIISMIETNQVVIIQGATGCGKTTQIPQYILDSCYERGTPCNIIITQPRRLAAITVARRVSQERNWPLGSLVGYQVGLNMKTSADTRLTFCTTGVLLQKLIGMKNMSQFTHVILDEVHERDQDTDFALLIVRKLLRTNSRTVKVILMSATINVQRFSDYFSFPVHNKLEPAPVIDLDKGRNKKTNFLISKYYLCQLKVLGALPEIQTEEPGITPLGYQVATKLISEFDRLESQGKKTTKGAVLVFLPGIHEIEELFNMLNNQSGIRKWWVRPLHSTVTTDEQESVFQRPPEGYRKIILSTNIAESSLTVPDIVYVIDFCLTKQLVCDLHTNFTSLQVCWASKMNCIQRAGRSGRVAEGRVYRLVPRHFYENILEEEGRPEILRCPLERVVLQAKILDMGEPKALLALSMDPPDLTNLENTILLLKEVGALLLTTKGSHNIYDGDITFMGRVMAKLPVDIHVAKLIILGHVFSVLEECIIMGAAMSLKSVFSTPFQERMAAYHSKLTWADSSCSDSIGFLNAFKVWRHNKLNGYFNRSVGGGEEGWAKRYFIQLRTMREVSALVNDLRIRLHKLGIEESVGPGRVRWSEAEKPLVLKIVLAGAFYPHYFVRGAQGGQVDERDAVRQLVGRNPCSSVFLQGLPTNQPGALYVKTIKEALKGCAEEMKVSFDGTCKVYVQFGRPLLKSTFKQPDNHNFVADIPGKVSMAVYRAVKLRQLKMPIVLNMMASDQAMIRAKELGLCPSRENPFKWEQKEIVLNKTPKVAPLPSIDTSYITLQVAHIIDPGHLWAQNSDEEGVTNLLHVFHKLNQDKRMLLTPADGKPNIGDVLVAPYTEQDTYYYRARVDAIHPRRNDEPLAEVFYIDFGNSGRVKLSELRIYDKDNVDVDDIMSFPPIAFECVLSEIQPSLIRNPRGLWTEEATKEFKRIVLNQTFYGKIYSVVHGIISLELIKQNESGSYTPSSAYSLNQYLIRKGYAESAEESYLSKVNHELREQHMDMDIQQRQVYEQQQLAEPEWNSGPDPEPPSKGECRLALTLKGPFSPLEMKVYNLTQVGIRRAVMVEWSSVNSVLLDTDPQDPHERLLVAACVGQNPQGDRLTLRHTTLMPNIHGLPALVSLIFSPTIELRVNNTHTQYTGVLCGLGADPETGKAVFPDHDMEVTFDSEVTLEDILNINRLRYWMTVSLYTDQDSELPDTAPADVLICQNKVKEFLFKLLSVKRKSVELELSPRPFVWNQVPKHLLMNPGEIPENERGIFRLHSAVQLVVKEEQHEQMEHIKSLHAIAAGKDRIPENLRCLLCSVSLPSIQGLRVHLKTAQHKEKELHAADDV